MYLYTYLMHFSCYSNALFDQLGDAQSGLLLVNIRIHVEQILFDHFPDVMQIGGHSRASLLGCLLLLALPVILAVVLIIAVLHKNGLAMNLTEHFVGVVVVAKGYSSYFRN